MIMMSDPTNYSAMWLSISRSLPYTRLVHAGCTGAPGFGVQACLEGLDAEGAGGHAMSMQFIRD